jgi:hypothetical protein
MRYVTANKIDGRRIGIRRERAVENASQLFRDEGYAFSWVVTIGPLGDAEITTHRLV